MTYLNQLKSIALRNKYTRIYCLIIARSQKRANTKKDANKLLGYSEEHHILPKSLTMGGEKDKLNYAYLSAREHLICHLLLARMFDGEFKIKMCYALHSMHRIMKRNKQHKLTSWEYQKLREANSYARQSSPGTFKNKKHKPESIELMRINANGFKKGNVPHNFGKKNSADHYAKQIEGMKYFRETNNETYKKTLENLKSTPKRELNRKAAIKEKLSGSGNHNYDYTIYTFKHKKTLEIIKVTRNELITKYGCQSQNVYRMIKGACKSVSGWQLVTI